MAMYADGIDQDGLNDEDNARAGRHGTGRRHRRSKRS